MRVSTLLLLLLLVLGTWTASAQTLLEETDSREFREASGVLTRIEQLIADNGGGAWAIDAQLPGVIRFTEGGEMVVLGREGEGPGEFRRPWRMSLVRDTLWVVDLGLDRINGLDPVTGEPLGVIRGGSLWRGLPEAANHAVAPLQVTETGVLVALEERATSTVGVFLLDRGEAGGRHRILDLDQSDADLRIGVPGHSEPIRITNPFSNADLLALDDHGRYVAGLRQRPEFEVELVDLSEEPEPTVLFRTFQRRQLRAEERSRWLAKQEGLARSFTGAGFFASEAAAREAIEDALEMGPAPVVRRVTRGVLERAAFIDEDGGVWFERWSPGDSPREWHRLSKEGEELKLTLQSREELLDLAGPFLWKQRFDSLGVPHVTRVEVAVSRDYR
jgi:hypothetical protein